MASDELPDMTTADLGGLGESTLNGFCHQASMFPNPVKRDEGGFDNVVQVICKHDAPAYDLMPAPIRAYLQVKATRRNSGKVGIRLTNWHTMASDCEPWFVFVCEADEDRQVSDAYLVHIDEEWQKRALQRLREYSAKGKELGDNKLDLHYGENDRLPRLHGLELRERLLDAIGGDIKAYKDKKEAVFKTCGYEGETHTVRITLPSKPISQHYVEWTELALGLRSQIDILHLERFDRRFGEEVVTVDAPARLMTVKVRPSRDAFLRFYNPTLGHHTTRMAVYSTGAFPLLPASLSQLRFTVGPLSLYVELGDGTAVDGDVCLLESRITWDFEAKCILTELGDAARALQLMHSPDTSITMEICDSDDRSIDFRLGNFPPIEEHRSHYLQTVSAIAIVARHVGLDKLLTRAGDLELVPWTALLAASTVDSNADATLTFAVENVDPQKKPVFVLACGFGIGEWVVVCCACLSAKPQEKPAELTFTSEGARLMSAWKVRRSDYDDAAVVEKQTEAIKQLEKDDALQVFQAKPLVARLLEHED